METNEYWIPLDRNGYAPSIFRKTEGCYLCGSNSPLQRHEIFHGTVLRKRSKEYGLWINVCQRCHNLIHNSDGKIDKALKITAEKEAILHYGWAVDDFRQRFGKNWLEVDDDG